MPMEFDSAVIFSKGFQERIYQRLCDSMYEENLTYPGHITSIAHILCPFLQDLKMPVTCSECPNKRVRFLFTRESH